MCVCVCASPVIFDQVCHSPVALLSSRAQLTTAPVRTHRVPLTAATKSGRQKDAALQAGLPACVSSVLLVVPSRVPTSWRALFTVHRPPTRAPPESLAHPRGQAAGSDFSDASAAGRACPRWLLRSGPSCSGPAMIEDPPWQLTSPKASQASPARPAAGWTCPKSRPGGCRVLERGVWTGSPAPPRARVPGLRPPGTGWPARCWLSARAWPVQPCSAPHSSEFSAWC